MTRQIYIIRRRTGTIATEYQPISEDGGICEAMTVEIPDKYEPYTSVTDETVITANGTQYLLNQALRVRYDGVPYIKAGGSVAALKIISRDGVRSMAMHLEDR